MWIASIDHCRQAICMPIVCFDYTDPEDVRRVQEVNRVTTEIFLDKGWLNYRPDPYVHAPLTFARAKAYYDLLRRFREVIDPNFIMHPGRLSMP